jgi:flagellar biosynthesis protein FlgN
MEPSFYRDHLQRLLNDQQSLLVQLESLLDEEHTNIAAQDIDTLERTGVQRQAYVGDLMRIEDERLNLCRMLGKPSTPAGLDDLMKWCDPTRTLRAQMDECTTIATRCRDANDRNGMLVSARLKHVQGMLDVITGRAQPVTYGKSTAYAAAPTGRMVSREA